MKQVLMWCVIAVCAVAFNSFHASAKDKVAGLRMEIASVEHNDNEFSVFTYTDNDGSTNYYLGLGSEFSASEELGFEILGGSFSLVDDVCLCIGETRDEALGFLDALVDLFDEDVNHVTEFPGRLSTGGGERLGDPTVVSCMVKKKFLGGKYLQFQFKSGKHHAHADLGKSAVKQLRSILKKAK